MKAAQQSVDFTTNQYKAGTVSYLNVLIAQTVALNDEVTAVGIASRRMTASVLLVKALGGGWDASILPSAKDFGRKDPKQSQSTENKPLPVDLPNANTP